MSSIYGWLSLIPSSNVDIARFRQNAGNFSEAAPFSRAEAAENAAVGGHGVQSAPYIFQNDKLLVVMTGRPKWSEPLPDQLNAASNPAEILALSFNRYGRLLLEKISGAFSFGILDFKRQHALLAIDRMGINPLAVYCRSDLLVFGSQISQILAYPDVNAPVDAQGIFNYLYFHMVPSPGTIYKDITKLQPGEYFEFDNGQSSRAFYWQPPAARSGDKKNVLSAQLPVLIEEATAECFEDSQTGTFLSGGLDSTTVTGMLQKIARRPIDAFTMGFDAKGYDEIEYARAAARHFKVNLHEYYVTPKDVLRAIPLIAKTYDEPFGNASAIPAYYCAKLAREHGMVRLLAGDGGDEIFAGNARYAKQKLFDLYRFLPSLASKAIDALPTAPAPFRKLKSYVDQARIPMPERTETYNFLHRTPLPDIFQEDFLRHIDAAMPLAYLRQTYQRSQAGDLLKQMLFLDGKFTLADNDLRKVNRMCELAGIDVCYPLLNEKLVAFAYSIPSSWLMQGFELRSFYRNSLKTFLPRETLQKSKHGFGLPFGIWMSSDEELKQFAEANLQGIAQRGFLNPSYIRNLIRLHQDGHASYYGVMIWILVMLEQWLSYH